MTLAKMSRGQKGEMGRERVTGGTSTNDALLQKERKKDELFKFRIGKSFNFFPFI